MAEKAKKATKGKRPPEAVGWREWVSLPELGIEAIKAKVDTGALSSALHAYDVRTVERDGKVSVRFKVHPYQRETRTVVESSAPLREMRWVRSSSGHRTLRPVIVTPMVLMGRRFEIELTLTNRDAMGFRMLLGRRALRKRFLVDPGKSYLSGKELARLARGARAQPGVETPKKFTRKRKRTS